MATGGRARFGDALAPPGAVVSLLQSVYNDASGWWAQTRAQLDPNSAGGSMIFGLDYTVAQLDFNAGYGAQMMRGSFAWANYRDALDGFIKGIIAARSQSGFDTSVDADPVAGWYYYTATPKLATLPALWAAGTVGQTAGDVGGAALGALPWWVWVGGAGIILLYLSSFAPRRTMSEYRRSRLRR